MRIGRDGRMVPYQTKAERIQQLEDALSLIEHASTLEEAQNIAIAHRRTDGRWRKESPVSYAAVKAVEDAGG